MTIILWIIICVSAAALLLEVAATLYIRKRDSRFVHQQGEFERNGWILRSKRSP